MLGKLALLMQSKTALAVLGIVLVGGSGGAVAAAAATGHLTTHGIDLNSETASTKTPDSHANTVGVEGLLTACNTTAAPNTISVTDSAGKSWTFVVSATTKINGDTHTASHGASSAQGSDNGAGASSSKGDNSTHAGDSSDNGAGASSSKGDNSAKGAGASSEQGDNSAHAGNNSAHAGNNSAHAAPTLADVCTTSNIGSRTVQVQATADGANYDAWKVTLQGPGSANAGSASDDSSTGGSSSASGD